MKTIFFLMLAFSTTFPLLAFADQKLDCELIDGNVNKNAHITIDELRRANLTIDKGQLSFSAWDATSSVDMRFTPDWGPVNSEGLQIRGQFETSSDGRFLTVKQVHPNCGRYVSTSCHNTGTFDLKTNQFHVNALVGRLPFLKYYEVDYVMQCKPSATTTTPVTVTAATGPANINTTAFMNSTFNQPLKYIGPKSPKNICANLNTSNKTYVPVVVWDKKSSKAELEQAYQNASFCVASPQTTGMYVAEMYSQKAGMMYVYNTNSSPYYPTEVPEYYLLLVPEGK